MLRMGFQVLVAIVGILAAGTLLLLAAVWQIRRRHMERWLPAYFRERRTLSRSPGPTRKFTSSFASPTTTSPRRPRQAAETGRQRVAAWVERLSQAVRPLPRQRRPPAAPHVLLSDRGIRAGVSRRARRAVPRRLRRGRDPPAPRQRHAPRTCGPACSKFKEILANAARPAVAPPPHRRGDVRLHPRQLGAVQLAARRRAVRRQQRDRRSC